MSVSDLHFAALCLIWFSAALVLSALIIHVWTDVIDALDRRIDRRVDMRFEKW